MEVINRNILFGSLIICQSLHRRWVWTCSIKAFLRLSVTSVFLTNVLVHRRNWTWFYSFMALVHCMLAVILSSGREDSISFSHVHFSDFLWFNGETFVYVGYFIEDVGRVEPLWIFSISSTYFSTLNAVLYKSNRHNAPISLWNLSCCSRIWSRHKVISDLELFLRFLASGRIEILVILLNVHCCLYRIWIIDAQINFAKFAVIACISCRQSALAAFHAYLFTVEDLMLWINQRFNLILPGVMHVLCGCVLSRFGLRRHWK